MQLSSNKLLDFNIDGKITDTEYLKRSRECEQEAEALEEELKCLEDQLQSKEEFRKHLETLRTVMRKAQEDAQKGIINQDFIDQYIERIDVTSIDEKTARLDIKIFTGEITSKYLSRLKALATDTTTSNVVCRTGHTSKKMIEAYEQGLQ